MNPRSGIAAAALAAALPALAQTKPPVAQFWMDAATHNLSMPGMGDMEAMGGMSGGGFFGGAKMPGGAPGKWLDSALHTRNKPAGTEGSHAIPPAMAMGPALPLLPVKAARAEPGGGGQDGAPEKPKGRLLFYWGCGETVRPGQPRVVDFAKAGPEEFARFMAGRFAPDRGAKAVPGRAIWPNERDGQRVPKEASLAGEHAITGEGVPAGLRFAVGAAHDFMPKVQMAAQGDLKGPVGVEWPSVAHAQGYFLSAMGVKDETDMIVWSSSELPDPGWGLMDYLPPAQITKLLAEKVILPPTARRCAIPAGIYAGAEGAMVRMIAYGPELNLAYPPRPADPKAPWNPEWAVRLRVKSTGMTLLGMEDDGGARRDARRGAGPREEAAPPPQEEAAPVLKPLDVIKGLFGR